MRNQQKGQESSKNMMEVALVSDHTPISFSKEKLDLTNNNDAS